MKRLQTALLSAFFLLALGAIPAAAQTDSLVFHNGNYITGSVESMDKGIFVFSTDYSDDDFTIEWEKIKEIYTVTTFIVTLSDGTDHKAIIQSEEPGQLRIVREDGSSMVVSVDDVVELNPISDAFLDRLSASWDLGYSYTKSNNNTQFNARTFLGYEAERWNTDISFDALYTDQDDVEQTQMINGTWNFRYNMLSWVFLIATVDLLRDSEQLLDLRANTQLGAGAYMIRSNAAYWSAKLGINRNFEKFTPPDDINNRSSWEGFAGTELNIYDLGDLDILTSLVAYPGITEAGRWRADLKFDVKYEFPMDFYVKGGFTLNYDNQPVGDTDPTNIIFLAGFGWEW